MAQKLQMVEHNRKMASAVTHFLRFMKSEMLLLLKRFDGVEVDLIGIVLLLGLS